MTQEQVSVPHLTKEEILRQNYIDIQEMFTQYEGEQIIKAMEHYKDQFIGDGWISVEEKLPEINKNILVWHIADEEIKGGTTDKARYTGHEFYTWMTPLGFRLYHVTHWQLLPKPPQSKQ